MKGVSYVIRYYNFVFIVMHILTKSCAQETIQLLFNPPPVAQPSPPCSKWRFVYQGTVHNITYSIMLAADH